MVPSKDDATRELDSMRMGFFGGFVSCEKMVVVVVVVVVVVNCCCCWEGLAMELVMAVGVQCG